MMLRALRSHMRIKSSCISSKHYNPSMTMATTTITSSNEDQNRLTPIEDDRQSQLTVIELFQSQGCSSCPPANTNILNLISDQRYLVLTYAVTYWDYLGWKDTFGNKAWDRRQREYARALSKRNVYTPQVIVNGRVDGVGSRSAELDKLIQVGCSTPMTVQVHIANDLVAVSGLVEDGVNAPVWMVRYDPGLHHVEIPRGENTGKTLPHQNVVREVMQIGTWHSGMQTYALPYTDREDGLQTAILVQGGKGGPILGATRVD